MESKRAYMRTLGIVAIVLFAHAIGQADSFFKQVTSTDPMKIMGKATPATVDTTEIWISASRAAQKGTDGKGVLVAADEKKLYLIDHNKKKITSIAMGESGLDVSAVVAQAMKKSQEENGEMTPEQKAAMDKYSKQFSGMASALAASIKMTVTPTNETKTVKSWNTKKYVVDVTMPMGGSTKSEMWVSPDITVNMDAYRQLMYATMASMPGFTDMLNESKKIEGFPVLVTTDGEVMGSKLHSVSEVVETMNGDAPAGTYNLPDYPVETLDLSGQ